MIADDDVNILASGISNGRNCSNTAIDRYKKRWFSLGVIKKTVKTCYRQPVAFGKPIGNMIRNICPKRPQEHRHHCRTRRAVHVIIAVNGDELATTNGGTDT